MPLPKIPAEPATMLLVKDYPKAEPGRSPVRSISAKTDLEVDDLISGQAVPTPKSRARRKAQDTLAAAQAPLAAPVAAAPAAPAVTSAAPSAATPAPAQKPGKQHVQEAAPVSAKLREPDTDQPHPAKHKPVETPIKSSTSRKADQSGMTKVFVLDTNVLMHDPSSLFRFEEHDVYLPMMTLEELDNHKKGMSEVARNARQVSRTDRKSVV